MGVLEIVMLLAGGILAVLSFALPVKTKEEVPQETRELAKEEIKTLVKQEMDSIRQHVDDVVDEAVGYAVEKTERSLERLTNEKIMAVNEYSDTVLQEIHKNHEEAMFLYDMLNDKHTSLKNTVSEAGRTAQELEAARREAEAVVSSCQQLKPERVEGSMEDSGEWDFFEEQKAGLQKTQEIRVTKEPQGGTPSKKESSPAKKDDAAPKKSAGAKKSAHKKTEEPSEGKASPVMDLNFMTEGQDGGANNKEQILQLYKQGKSTVAIAKELGLGVGEVKLVIDLYKNL